MPRKKTSLPLLLTVDEFIGSHPNRAWSRRLANDPVFQLFWMALRNGRPKGRPLVGLPTDRTSSEVELGFRMGYDHALATMQTMLWPDEPKAEPDPMPDYA